MIILFLNASPRTHGKTSRILHEIERHIPPEHTIQWVDVNSLNINPCLGCLACRPDHECILPEDDAHHISRMIRNADALVIGSPTYFGNITGPLRTLIDRSLTAFEKIAASGLESPVPIHRGQKAAIITSCNMPAPMSLLPTQGAGAIAAMQIVTDAGGYDLVGTILLDGAALLDALPENIRQKAQDIALALT